MEGVQEPSLKSASGEFEEELPLAAKMKEVLGFIVSKLFYYLRLSVFSRALPNLKDEELLKKCHKTMISELEEYIRETLEDVFDESQIISSLNELHTMIEQQPITFEDVWRPSDDPDLDIEAHIHEVNRKYKTLFIGMLDDIKRDNVKKMATIELYESEILALRDEMKRTSERIKVKADILDER